MNVEPESEFEVNDINMKFVKSIDEITAKDEFDDIVIVIATTSYVGRPIGIVTYGSFVFEFIMMILLIAKLLSSLSCKIKRKKDEAFNRIVYC